MKRRGFLGALAAVIAVPKALLAMKPAQEWTELTEISGENWMPSLPNASLFYDASSPLNVVDSQGNVLVLRDLSGNNNHGFSPNVFLSPGSRIVAFDEVLSDDQVAKVHQRLLGR